MIYKSLKISFVSAINFFIKNLLVFLIFDFFNNKNEYFYVLILVYIYFQSYILHLKFTLRRKINVESFILFLKLNLILFIIDYSIFFLISKYFPYVVLSTILISFIIHSIRIILFSREMD